MRARTTAVLLVVLAGTGCGGSSPEADLCLGMVAERMSGRVYEVNASKVARSQQAQPDGSLKFAGEVVLQPGTSAEVKQTFDCTVAPASDGAGPRVIGFQFNISGTGLTN